jgi:hypothetical protein
VPIRGDLGPEEGCVAGVGVLTVGEAVAFGAFGVTGASDAEGAVDAFVVAGGCALVFVARSPHDSIDIVKNIKRYFIFMWLCDISKG